MEIKYKYEFIVDGEVVDRLFAKSREELKEMIDIMKPLEIKYTQSKTKDKEPKLKVPREISFNLKDKNGKNKKVTFKSRRGTQSKPKTK